MLYDIGQLMGKFHNINVSSHNNEDSWVVTILSDMMQIRLSLAPYESDFIDSITFVERENNEGNSNIQDINVPIIISNIKFTNFFLVNIYLLDIMLHMK